MPEQEQGTEDNPVTFDYDPELAKVRCDVKVKSISVNLGHTLIPCGRRRPCPRHSEVNDNN